MSASTVLALGASTASAAPATTNGLTYVALGDSYAAGLGLAPATGLPVPVCAQSAADYPHQTAAALALRLTDVSCSAAKIENLTTAQGAAAPQLTALGASTKVVTITIGGNDLGFSTIAAYCVAASPTGPLLADPTTPNCRSHFAAGGNDTLAAAIAGVVAPKLAAAYAAITAAAPNAKVFVVGYPSITPSAIPANGCFTALTNPNSFPFTTTDTAYLHSVEQKLDDATRAAATAAGFTFVSNLAGTDAHSACATVDPYVNGVTLTPSGPSPASLHPNASGVSYLSGTIRTEIEAAFRTQAPPVPSTPTNPAAANPAVPALPIVAG